MAGQVSRAVKLCGTEQVDPPSRVLRAGPLSAELENGALRYVRLAGTEMIRAIAFLSRRELGHLHAEDREFEDCRARRRIRRQLPRQLRGCETEARL